MKISVSLKLVSIVLLCIFAFFLGPKAHAGDDVTVVAVAKWITQNSKDTVTPAQATKIAKTVFSETRDHRIDPFLVVSMIYAESMFQVKAKSAAGAKGLMQVMPRWHRDKIANRNIFDIQTNIEVGLQILQDCLLKVKDRTTHGLKCYSGGASKKYEQRILSAHSSLKQAVVMARFENEAPISAIAAFNKPRSWHDQVDQYERSQLARLQEEETRLAARQYETLVIASAARPMRN